MKVHIIGKSESVENLLHISQKKCKKCKKHAPYTCMKRVSYTFKSAGWIFIQFYVTLNFECLIVASAKVFLFFLERVIIYILLSSCPILYSYTASVQDIKDGIVRMNRKVTSKDVKDYASHIPGDEVDMEMEENIVYKRGVLTHSDGTVKSKLMGKV